MVAPAVLELPGRAGDTLCVPPAAVTTVLQDMRSVMQLWPGATSGPKVAQRGLAPLLWGQGQRGATAHVKGPQSPWRAEATRVLGQGTQGSHLLPMGHIEGA